ncbi:hypothetical protein BZL39_F06120 [Zygosaccharomyces parabailii]|nr:hypothetical protein BZL39_F06120 [Zygosaccharomyces parabailii]
MTVDKARSHLFQGQVVKRQLECVGTCRDGQWLVLEDPLTNEKKQVYDAVSGAAVCSLFHGDKEILSQLNDYAQESAYTFCTSYSNRAAEDLAALMCSKSTGCFESATFVCSGSEANENAMKYIKQYHLEKGEPQRFKFISRHNAYHGYTIGSLSIGDNPKKPLLKNILLSDEQTPKISRLCPYRDMKEGMSEEEYTKNLLDNLEETFIKNDPSTVAGVIMETVCGSALGTTTPPKGYLDGARAIAHKYGALFMLDEVMCGLGRTGYPFAFMDPELGLSTGGPDIMTFGKTIGSGYVSLSGVLFSPKVVKTIEEGSGMAIGFQTYQSHHLNCRVGLAVQRKLHENNLIENVRVVGAYLKDQLKKQLKGCKVCGDVRGAGNFLSVELVKDRSTKEFFPPEMRMSGVLYQKTFQKGAHFICLSGCAGYEVKDGKVIEYGDHLTMAPAFGFSKEDADFIVKVVKETFTEVEEQYL